MGQNALAFVAKAFSGKLLPGQVDQQSALWEAARHGKYYAGAYGKPAGWNGVATNVATAGSTFRGANQTGATLSAGLAATYTGLCLSNPAGSLLNLVVHKAGAVVTNAVSGQLGLGLITGWLAAGVTAHTSSLNSSILNSYVGASSVVSPAPPLPGPAPVANLDAACTLVGTPLWSEWLQANAAANSCLSFYSDLEDSLIIPPGGYVAIGGTAAQGGFFGSYLWEELAP